MKNFARPRRTAAIAVVTLSLCLGLHWEAQGATNITVSASIKRVAVAGGQTLTLSATTNDPAGVVWSGSAGRISPDLSLSGAPVTFFAPNGQATVTIKVASRTNSAVSTSITIYVTNLVGVWTYHNDPARDGTNNQEIALTPSTVTTATFGKSFSCQTDGAIYTQPLWLPNVTVGTSKHNIVFAATQHDSLYAFDADASPCVMLWHANLIDTAHGANAGETSIPSGPSGYLVGQGNGDISPEVGVTGTPVIDYTTGTLFVVSKSMNAGGTSFYQRLHAIDITTGKEKSIGPANIGSNITYPGTGDGGKTVTFNPRQQAQRTGLAIVSGVIYVAWASHEDNPPYYGWVVGFGESNLAVKSVLNVTPNVGYGGIWMGGGAPSVDSSTHMYLITGNGAFDATSATAPKNDYGDSFLRLTGQLGVVSHFTPSDEQSLNEYDGDFGSGGSAVVLNLTSGPLQHLVVGGGKDGTLYLLNGDAMGGLGDSNARQFFNTGGGIFATGAFWNNNYYIAPVASPLANYAFDASTDLFNTQVVSQSTTYYGFPGTTPSISADGTANGIVWALDNSLYCTEQSPGCGPAVLHAYNAMSLSTDLWNSSMVAGDVAGYAVKFTVPTVANGHVYIGTRGNNTGNSENSTSRPGELDVYGLKPN
jgi:hypothetical protein